MDLAKGLFESKKNRDEFGDMVELYEEAIRATEKINAVDREYNEKRKYIEDAQDKIVQYNEAAANAKKALNEVISTLSERKAEARLEINAEKEEAIKEKELAVEEINAKIRGKQANLLVLEKREEELAGSVERMKANIIEANKMVS